ncbi:MAG: replication initiation factor domain-containing protein [Gammaproteobacteria bacterium]|nr:replication initiation factor domain-containing protein [Gammaproteobacteria bacterium]
MPNNITNAFFDMTGFTVAVPEPEKIKVRNNLHKITVDPEYKKKYRPKYYSDTSNGSNRRYGNLYIFDIPNGTEAPLKAIIQIFPRNKNHNFANVQINPSKIGIIGESEVRKLLINIFDIVTARRIYYEARLVRLDTTVDSYNPYDETYMYMERAQVSKIIRQNDGSIESQITGSNNSDIRITQYDKDAEQTHKGQVINSNWQRLEIRMRDLGFSMADIPEKLENNFKKLCFYTSDFMSDDYFDKNFLTNVYDNGINSALHQVDNNMRKRYLRRLTHYQCDPFRLERLSIDHGVRSLSFLQSKKYKPSKGIKRTRSFSQQSFRHKK